MKAKIKTFFLNFKRIPVLNFVFVLIFIILNIVSYVILSNTRTAKEEAISASISELTKKSNSGRVNLSFISYEEEDQKTFLANLSFAYNEISLGTDSKNNKTQYGVKVISNANEKSNSFFLERFDSSAVGIFCYSMNYDKKNDKYIEINYQVCLEFPNKGSAKSDFKEGTTNFIYIRWSDAENLVNDSSSPYYGLTHKELLGKPINITAKAPGKNTVKDKWKIENIILEEVDGVREPNDSYLFDNFGTYYLSSRYGLPFYDKFALNYEMSNKTYSNSRVLKSALERNLNSSVYIRKANFESKNFENVDHVENAIENLRRNNNNDVLFFAPMLGMIVMYYVAIYVLLSRIKTGTKQNVFMFIVSFALVYLFFFVFAKISISNVVFFNNAGTILNVFLTIFTIAFAVTARIDINDFESGVNNKTKEIVESEEEKEAGDENIS